MEAIKHHQGTMDRFNQSFFLKKATVVSVSIFSLIFSYSFSSYALQVAHNIDKSYMFLLCNGILVLIVKNSAGLLETSQQESDELYEKNAMKRSKNQAEAVKSSEEKQQVVQETEKLSASVCMVCAAEEEQEEQENEVVIIAADQDDQEDVPELLSIEELNKKCDDFIRKMKEEMKFN